MRKMVIDMSRMIIVFQPFCLNQLIEMTLDDFSQITYAVHLTEIPQTVAELALSHQIDIIDLVGENSFTTYYKEKIEQELGDNKTKVEIIRR